MSLCISTPATTKEVSLQGHCGWVGATRGVIMNHFHNQYKYFGRQYPEPAFDEAYEAMRRTESSFADARSRIEGLLEGAPDSDVAAIREALQSIDTAFQDAEQVMYKARMADRSSD